MRKLILILLFLIPVIKAQTHNILGDTNIVSITGIDTGDVASINTITWLGYPAGGELEETLISTSGSATGASDATTFASGKEKCGNNITPDATYQLSRLDFAIQQVNGDKNGYYKAEVWTMTGDNLTSKIATSIDSIAGTALATTGWNSWHFSSYVTLTSGTKYGLVMSKTSAGDANNPQLRYADNDWSTGEVAQSYYWTMAGAYVYKYDGEWAVRFYGVGL